MLNTVATILQATEPSSTWCNIASHSFTTWGDKLLDVTLQTRCLQHRVVQRVTLCYNKWIVRLQPQCLKPVSVIMLVCNIILVILITWGYIIRLWSQRLQCNHNVCLQLGVLRLGMQYYKSGQANKIFHLLLNITSGSTSLPTIYMVPKAPLLFT